MSSIKYIAAGFQKDSERLLNEFVQENSTNFTLFTTKWKEHNFNLIFAGRDKEELYQFTNEIFQITLGYLENGSIFLQVGAVYLLYALYRNQTSSPLVQIRITLAQWEKLTKLQNLAEKNCYMHLHYIIHFLINNLLEYVANSAMLGPCCAKSKIEAEKTPYQSSLLAEDCKTNMKNFRDSNLLQEIKAMSIEYNQLAQQFFPNKAIEEEEIDECIQSLDDLLDEGKLKKRITNKEVYNTGLGDRRAKIKANQFSKKALFRQLNPSDSDEDYEPEEDEEKKGGSLQKQQKKKLKAKRVPKSKRKVGRPKKNDLDINELLKTDEIDDGAKVKTKKRRGPVQRGSYANKYELKIPDFNKTFFKEYMADCTSSETSEEESAACDKENEEGSVACKKEIDDTQDAAPNQAEGAYCNGYPEDDSSEDFTEASAKYNVSDITSYKTDEHSSDDVDDPDSNNTKEIYTLL